MKYPDISLFPSTDVVMGKITPDEYIEKCAETLYEDWVCGWRFEPEDVKKLIDIAVKLRKERESRFVPTYSI